MNGLLLECEGCVADGQRSSPESSDRWSRKRQPTATLGPSRSARVKTDERSGFFDVSGRGRVLAELANEFLPFLEQIVRPPRAL